jgi:predicted Zn-dependent peptidase
MMTYKEFKNESYNLYTIKTDKFKTCHMEIIFYNNFDKDKITVTNMLGDILCHSSLKYPKRKNVVEKLEDLYSANFYGVANRIGNLRTINFIYNFIDPVYTDKNYLKEVIKFPFDMIFNPNIKNNEFDLRSFKIMKNRNLADIESTKESPVRYSLKRAINIMNNTHPASYQLVGYKDALEEITPSNLVDSYHDFINNYKCDIYLIGNLNMEKVNIMINEQFRNNIIKNVIVNDIIVNVPPNKKIKNVIEYDNFAQASLFMIYTTNDFTEQERNIVMPIFNTIFANGSLNTKLSQNLREKNSLCYSVNAMFQKNDNLLFVYAGIDANNENKAVKLIKKSLKEMQEGDFTDEDVKNAIKYITGGLKSLYDSPDFLINNYFFHNLLNILYIEDKIKEVNKITKSDVIALAKKIKLSTIYMMAPGGNNNERN